MLMLSQSCLLLQKSIYYEHRQRVCIRHHERLRKITSELDFQNRVLPLKLFNVEALTSIVCYNIRFKIVQCFRYMSEMNKEWQHSQLLLFNILFQFFKYFFNAFSIIVTSTVTFQHN